MAWGLPCPLFWISSLQKELRVWGEVAATEDPNLEEQPEMGPEVTCFLRGLAENLEEDDKKVPPPEPPVKEFQKWVTWKAEAYKTPSWWRELMVVPEVEDLEKLAWEVLASFQLPKRVS